MFFIARCIIIWIIWLIFADKRRWKEILPVCILASFLGVVADIIVDEYPYWDYMDNDIHPLYLELGDEFEIFPLVTYLFIQWLPKKETLWSMFSYWFLWTGLAIIIEYIHLITGHMDHSYGWTIVHSYIADWILLWLFYKFHKILELKKLSN